MTKNNFRKSCKELLSKSKIRKVTKDYYILQRLFDIIQKERPKNILLFIPLDTEPNILKLINTLRKRKIKVFVPYMSGNSFRVVLYRLPIIKKRFGIKEPKYARFDKEYKIDLAVIPILGFDTTCRRIGFGKGMYDRYFQRVSNDIVKVFVQRDICYSSNNITQSHDIQADYIVSS